MTLEPVRAHRWVALLALVTGAAAAVFAALLTARSLAHEEREAFRASATQHLTVLGERIAARSTLLETLGALLQDTGRDPATAFDQVTRLLDDRHTGLGSFSWLPAGSEDIPVAAHAARDSGRLTASGLLPSGDVDPPAPAVALYQPVFATAPGAGSPAERRRSIRGYVRAVLDLDAAVAGMHPGPDSPAAGLLIYDLAAPPGRQLLYGAPGADAHAGVPEGRVCERRSARVGQRPWALMACMAPRADGLLAGVGLPLPGSSPHAWQPWAVLAGGLLLSALLAAYLWAVASRSLALAATNRTLEAEVAERARAEAALRRLTPAVEQGSSMVLITNADGVIEYVNPRYEEVSGYSASEVVGKRPSVNQSGHTPGITYDDLWSTIRRGATWQGELLNKKKNNELYWVSETITPIRDDDGRITQFVAVKEDITQRKRAEARIKHLATHDSLTNLPNRFLFNDRLRKSVAQARRREHRLGLLFIDLDGFKRVNDTLGHEAGDQLLQTVAERLRHQLRDADMMARYEGSTLARLGGDEFTAILTDLDDPMDASRVAQRMLNALAEPVTIGDQSVRTNASIGITVFPEHGEEPETLLKHADLALYRAKNEGRGRYRFFSDEMNEAAESRWALERDLEGALSREELWLAFQPQMDLRTQRMVGIETLLRWNHPQRGTLGHAALSAISPGAGHAAIQRWVLDTACEVSAGWQRDGLPPLPVSVNLTAAQAGAEDLPRTVKAALGQAGLEPYLLDLEIAEQTAVSGSAGVEERLVDLQALGVRLTLDEFGTGYASLSQLARFPITRIKLDPSFVRDVAHDTGNVPLIQGISALGHNLGMRVQATGVTTREQSDALFRHGVDEIQGDYVAPAMDRESITRLLHDRGADIGPLASA